MAGLSIYDIRDFGALGDGSTDDAAAIQRAIDACHAAGGGTVLVAAGRTFLSGAFALKSHVTLHIEGGAALIASAEHAAYPRGIMIEAFEAHNIALTGTGLIDGRARQFMVAELPHIFRGTNWRPRLIGLTGCRGITIRDLTIKDAAFWGLHLAGCEDVLIHGIRILNDLKVPNCDGIDPDHCRNVRISDCHIEAGDDCIVLKATREHAHYGACENITVTGCTLVSTSCAIKIGTETVGDIRNIVFNSCVIRSSSRGLGIMLRDEGNVENISFSNMIVETRLFHDDWWGKAEPIYVTAYHRTAGAPLGRIRHVRFRNILCRGENGVYIGGSPDSRPEDIVLDGVRVEVDSWSRYEGGRYDRRPCAGEGIVTHPTGGIVCQMADEVTVRDCAVRWGAQRRPYWRHALECEDVRGLRLDQFSGEAAHPEHDAIAIR